MAPIEWIPSPYYNTGWWSPPTNIALHCTAADLRSTLYTFTSPNSTRKVSAHFIVDGFEERIIQCVGLDNRAWHARDANEFAIGIEFVNNGPHLPVPERAYHLGAWLVADLCAYPLERPVDTDTVGPHSRWVATACPSGLDWEAVVKRAAGSEPGLNATQQEEVKALIRAVMLNETALTASALKRALSPYYSVAKPRVARSAGGARAGHGRGKSVNVEAK